MRHIAAGNTAEIYLRDDYIVKVYSRHSKQDVEYEAGTQAYARSLGLRVPTVIEVTEIDGLPALVMEHAAGVPMKDLMFEQPERAQEYLTRSVEIQREVHAIAAPELRKMSERLRQQIRSIDELSSEEKATLIELLEDVGKETRLCHGDLHVMNLIVDGDEVAIIDWMDATCGNPLLDACRTYVLYAEVDADLATAYLAEYCRQAVVAPGEVLRWKPVMTGARLSE